MHSSDEGKALVVEQQPQLAQLGAHASTARFRRPFVTHDAATDDNRLAAWSIGLDDAIADVSRPVPTLPVARAILIAITNDVTPAVVVDKDGYFPAFDVDAYGKFTDEVVAAFGSRYAGVHVFAEHLAFVCDFLGFGGAGKHVPMVVFKAH